MIGYYDHFPAKKMNVSVKPGPSQPNQPPKKILVAEKDFAEGEVIYKASALLPLPAFASLKPRS